MNKKSFCFWILLIIFFLFFPYIFYGQTTSVTAQITDSDGTQWANAQWKVQFYPNPNQTNQCQYQLNGQSLCSNAWKSYLQQSGTTDSSGNLSVTLLDNTQINPSGSKWVWTIQSNTSAPATFYSPVVISGASQNLTTFLSSNSQAPRFPALTINSYGYNDTEVSPTPTAGNSYFNTTTLANRYWNGTSFVTLINSGSSNSFIVTNPPYGTPTNHFSNPFYANYIWNGQYPAWSVAGGNLLQQGFSLSFFNSRPGWNQGNPTVCGGCGWSANQAFTVGLTNYGYGITSMAFSNTHTGIGDTISNYFYNWGYGGAVAASDEGTKAFGENTGEGVNGNAVTYQGTITSGTSTGATVIKTTCTADCNNQGDGRYVYNLTRPVATGCYVQSKTAPSGATPGSLTIGGCTVIASIAVGTLAADINTPIGNPPGTGTTNETFTVNVISGTFSTASGLICFAGNNAEFHEQTIASSVVGAGSTQGITAPLRQPHAAGTYVYQGGACGMGADFTALRGDGLKYVVDISGSPTTTTLAYTSFLVGGGQGAFDYLAPLKIGTVAIESLSNSGITVSFQFTTGGFSSYGAKYQGASVITISGASDSAFNTQCTNVNITNWNTSTATCTISSLTGSHTAASANVAYGDTQYGNGDFTLYQIAEAIDVQDHTANNSVDGTFNLEPNNINVQNSDTLEQGHHYAAIYGIDTSNLYVHNPNTYSLSGKGINLQGAGINSLSGPYGAVFPITNSNNWNQYAYFGGWQPPPNGFYWKGAFNIFNYLDSAPTQGGSLFYINCPHSGCADTNAYYDLQEITTNTDFIFNRVYPASNRIAWNSNNGNMIFSIPANISAVANGGPSGPLNDIPVGFGGINISYGFRQFAPTWQTNTLTSGDFGCVGALQYNSYGITDCGTKPTGGGPYVPTANSNTSTSGDVVSYQNGSGEIGDSGLAVSSICQSNGTHCPTTTSVIQSVSLTPCTTGAAAFSTCSTTATSWPTAFADTAYQVTCTGSGTMTGSVTQIFVTSKSTTSFVVNLQNGDANGAVASTFTSVDCVGRHN